MQWWGRPQEGSKHGATKFEWKPIAAVLGIACMVALAGCGGGSSSAAIASGGTDPGTGTGSGSGTGGSAADRSIALQWTTPQTRADGTPLVNLAGYKIYYGTVSGSYSNVITISDPAATSYQIANLSPATYYLTMRSYDTNGGMSDPTPEASKTIN